MLEDDNTTTGTGDQGASAAESIPGPPSAAAAESAAQNAAAQAAEDQDPGAEAPAPAKKAAKRAPRKTAAKKTTKKATAKTAAPEPAEGEPAQGGTPAEDGPAAAVGAADTPGGPTAEDAAPAKKTAKRPAKKAAAKTATTKKAAAKKTTAKKATAKKTTTGRTAKKAAADAPQPEAAPEEVTDLPSAPLPADPETTPDVAPLDESGAAAGAAAPAATALLFQPPKPVKAPTRRRKAQPAPADRTGDDTDQAVPASAEPVEVPVEDAASPATAEPTAEPAADTSDDSALVSDTEAETDTEAEADTETDTDTEADTGEQGGGRRRRRRGGRRRRKGSGGDDTSDESSTDTDASADAGEEPASAKAGSDRNGSRANGHGGREATERTDDADSADEGAGSTRRRRRRRRSGEEGNGTSDDPQNTVTRVRKTRSAEDEITSVSGSTRLEAKKQRRREGREAGRRRAPIVSEAEFLARREAVERVMVIRQRKDLTQIAVLEDDVLVEHYVARESQTSLIGNVYLGRVQNVLPSMEAAFIDIGKGRNAVLYAGEVNWDALGAGNGPRKIEQVLKSGQSILVQVSKDPIGHKGARLTSQISLPGRFLVYVPDGTTSGISRKLPDTERSRLKALLKEIVPESAGVIVRTAAEGASEEELTLDVERLTARWSDIESKVAKGNAPQLLYGEPDLTLKVVRDLFTEDFAKLVVAGDEAWDMVEEYVKHVAPDLSDRLERYDGSDDVFAAYRIDEQIAKGLDRKVWLPSGGSLIIDRTEAMTVVDVNTGKFTGSGGNLEETVTKNNLEAAEEMVRQLRLRDIGGIIVVDFIDMVLESNRDLVLRRLVECLGRDRTRHQVAEVTSLGLVQMTRKRIGTGLLEAFSETCEHCQGRGVIVHHEPVESRKKQDDEPRRGRRGRKGGRGEDESPQNGAGNGVAKPPSPKDLAALAKPEVRQADEPTPEPTPEPAFRTRDNRSDAPAEQTLAAPQVDAGTRDEPTVTDPQGPEGAEAPAAQQQAAPRETAQPQAAEPEVAQPRATEPKAPVVEATAAPEAPEPQTPSVRAAPRVVTSTRRRVVRRPAGPPSGSLAVADSASADGVPSAPDDAPQAASSAEPAGDVNGADHPSGGPNGDVDPDQEARPHVPVKKKGSRKR